MKLSYAHLADFVTRTEPGGKVAAIGIFDGIFMRPPSAPGERLTLPPFTVLSHFILDGFDDPKKPFRLEWRVLDDDAREVGRWAHPSIVITPGWAPGVPAFAVATFGANGIQVPGYGDYVWEFWAGPEEAPYCLGTLPMYVWEPPAHILAALPRPLT